MAFLQHQASTGLKHERISDDPLASEKLFSLKRTTSGLDADLELMQDIEPTLNLSVSNLTEAHQIVRAVQRVALDARQADESELPILAGEVDDLMNRLVNLANSTVDGRYQYAGQNDKFPPYVENPSGTNPPYVYQGSSQSMEISVSANIKIDLLQNGDGIFGTGSRGETVFLGDTGMTAGSGKDSGLGTGAIQVSHTSTSYAGASGVTTGLDSIALDTIIGQSGTHQLTLTDQSGTGAFGVVQLNNGLEIPWTSADDNLRVEDAQGREVFIDTQSIVAGFSGSIDITSNGELSSDDGLTSVPINFSSNQILIHSENQSVTNINSTGINRAGVEPIEYTGASDLFSTLYDLKNDILNSRDLPGKEWDAAIIRRDEDLERHADRILSVVGEQSVALESIEALKSRNRAYHLEISQVVDDIEGADLTDVVLQLQQEQNLLEYSYAVSSAILSQSILDYLR
jgi:flagellin-like hook-associated protein FlgL